MSVYKHGKNWKVDINVKGRRITKTGFRTKSLARAWERLQLELHTDGMISNTIQFGELVKRYKEEHLTLVGEGTAERYLIDIEYRLIPEFEFAKIDEITTSRVYSFRDNMLKNTEMSHKSINHCVGLLQSILNKALEWGYINVKPCHIKPIKIPKKPYVYWDQDEIQQFKIAIQGHQYEAAFRLAIDTGMRLGEIVALAKQDINFEQGVITVHRTWQDKLKKYGPTKGRNVRHIRFNPRSRFAELLHEACNKSKHEEIIFMTDPKLPSKRLSKMTLKDRKNDIGVRVGGRNLSGQRFQNVIKKAGLTRITFHGMRHTFATWYMIRGGNIYELQKLLGHSDIRMTMKYNQDNTGAEIPDTSWSDPQPRLVDNKKFVGTSKPYGK